MTKSKISVVIILMSIALLGIISLQMNWIMHDIRLKEQQFDQGVRLALNDVVNRVETREVFKVVSDNSFRFAGRKNEFSFFDDTVMLDLLTPPEPPDAPPFPPEASQVPEHEIRIRHESGDGHSHTIIRIGDKVKEKPGPDTQLLLEKVEMAEDSIEDLASETEKKIRLKMQKLNLVMSKMAFEFGHENQNILHRISPGKLDTMIGEELSCKGITIPYNFGIINRSNDSLVFAKTPGQADDLLKSSHRVILFPNDLFSKPDYLLVSFPGRMSYVLSSLWLMLAGSALFTLIIIFGFAYTIYVIFRQKKLSDIKTDFINNMTHEFKTPIATISLAVDSIKDPRILNSPEKISYFTGIIREENRRMNAQVENVLRMAQLEKGELQMKMDEINIHDLIENSVDFISLQVTRKGGEIRRNFNAANPVINGDSFHISNVINNLLDNANKYSPETPFITIETENDHKGVLIHVSDRGMGMNAATLEKIFDKFYRVPTGNIHNIKGFGLGLSYVKAIVEAHHGTVSVSSESGKGSRFTVFLPFNLNN